MAIKITPKMRPGEFYFHRDQKKLYRLESFSFNPTATLKDVCTGLRLSGEIGSLLLNPLVPIIEVSTDELCGALDDFVEQLKRGECSGQ